MVAAFYSVIREITCGFAGSQEELGAILHRLQMPIEDQREFAAWLLNGGSLLRDFGTEPHVAALMQAAHHNAWIAVESVPHVAVARRGALPGHTLADMLFNFTMRKVLAEVQDRLAAEGLVEVVPWSSTSSPFLCEDEPDREVLVTGVTFIDDENLVSSFDTADQCIDAAVVTVKSYAAAFAKFGSR